MKRRVVQRRVCAAMGVRIGLVWLLAVPVLATEISTDPDVVVVNTTVLNTTVVNGAMDVADLAAQKAQLESQVEAVSSQLDMIAEQRAAELRARADLPEKLQRIANNFDKIDERIELLKEKFMGLQEVAQRVNSTAEMMTDQVVVAENTLVGVRSLALQNKVKAAAMRQVFAAEAVTNEKIKNTRAAMMDLKGTLSKVEEKTMRISQVAVEVGEDIGELKLAVDELLPGREYLPSRIKRAQDHLKAYQGSDQSGNLDPIVASTIRGNFLRAQRRTERLAEDALQETLAEDGEDESADGGGADGSSADEGTL